MLESIRNELKMLDIQHLRRHLKICNSPCNTHIDVGGKDFLMFCNNDYLGLANHPELVEAMISGTKRYGVGSGASHLVSGYSRAHYDLEQHLNQWFAPHFEKARSLYFSNAYMANLGVLTTLGNLNSVIFSEELNHASLIDGIRLTRGAMQIYPHRNVSALAKLLEKSSAPHNHHHHMP